MDPRLMPIGHGKFMKISSGRDELLAILNNKAPFPALGAGNLRIRQP